MTDYSSTTAEFSEDGRYRYYLTRRWDKCRYPIIFALLNPSTATAETDDPTIRRCIGYARKWGYGGLIVVNLFALRSPNPETLYTLDDPVGPENKEYWDKAIHEACQDALYGEGPGYESPILCGWGDTRRLYEPRRGGPGLAGAATGESTRIGGDKREVPPSPSLHAERCQTNQISRPMR